MGLGANTYITAVPMGPDPVQQDDGGYDSEGVVQASCAAECARNCEEREGCKAFTFYETGGYYQTGKRCKLMSADEKYYTTADVSSKTFSSWLRDGHEWPTQKEWEAAQQAAATSSSGG
eukprot:scaffold85638_cov11-Prasinocladus_malaysianus.AAC.1